MKSVPHSGSVWLFAALPPPVRKASGFPEVSVVDLLRLRQRQSRKVVAGNRKARGIAHGERQSREDPFLIAWSHTQPFEPHATGLWY